jgi:hypothetical protein
MVAVGALVVAMLVPLTVFAQEKEGVAVTVYKGGYGVVREVRKLAIGADGKVLFKDVPTAIDATSVHFKSLTDGDAKLLEQNYQYDLVSAERLLHKYIDNKIEVVTDKQTYSGTLLSFDGGQIVLRQDNGSLAMIQRLQNVRDIRFASLPGGLLTRPTLAWLVATKKPGEQMAEVSYQTTGMNWHAEYVMVLNPEDTQGELSGWVSVENSSGKTYTDAKMKFIAGDVRRVQEPYRAEDRYSGAKAGARPASEPMEEKAFFEYHMYTLPRPSTVANNEMKQLEMFAPARGVKVDKKYLYQPLGRQFRWYGGRYTDRSYGVTSEKKVNVFIEFRNSEKNKLGMPLPAGKVRVYKQDQADKAMEFVGEEKIDHTPKDEDVSLYIGNAFDVVGERKQTDFKVETSRNWMSESFEVKVRNHKKEAVTVRIKEPLYRWSTWRVTAKSHEFTQLDARNIAFDVKVEPDKETVVTYTVEYTW